jgi:hypothetical protein
MITKIPASENIVDTSHIAALTGLRRRMHIAADTTAEAKKIQKTVCIGYSPLGSEGSHSVDTGCVWEESRSRSYTNRSREYSEFS